MDILCGMLVSPLYDSGGDIKHVLFIYLFYPFALEIATSISKYQFASNIDFN